MPKPKIESPPPNAFYEPETGEGLVSPSTPASRIRRLQKWHGQILDAIRSLSMDDDNKDIQDALKPARALCVEKLKKHGLEMPPVGALVWDGWHVWRVSGHDADRRMFDAVRESDREGYKLTGGFFLEAIYIDWEPVLKQNSPGE